MALQFRRGTEADRTANGFIPLDGEPVYTTDTKKLYIGDGETVGGVAVGSSNDIGEIGDVNIQATNVVEIQTVSAANNLVTVVTKTPHGFATGESVLISSVVKPEINGVHVIFEASISYITYSLIIDDFDATTDSGALRYEVDDGAILAYDQATATWRDQSFAYEMRDLGDVEITDPVEQDILQYTTIQIGNILDNEGNILSQGVEEPDELSPGQTWTQTGSQSKFINKQLNISVDNLNDVLINEGSLSNRQIIAYDPNLTIWRNTDYVDKLTDLSDVSISGATEDQILTYDGSIWTNKSFEINNFDLNSLTDVEITDLQENQILQYSDSKWRNVENFVSLDQFADVELSAPFDGQALIYENDKFRSRAFRLGDLANINDLTDQVEIPNNSVLAFDNVTQKWIPQSFASLAQRTEITINTGAIEDLAITSINHPIFPGFIIYKIQCSAAPTTVSMYVTSFYRDIDLSRPEDEFPGPGAGIFAEMTPPDTLYRVITPVIHGFNDDVPINNTAYFKVRNRTGYYQSNIEIKLTVLQIERLPDYG